MYHPKDIIELIAGNLRATRNPFGISNAVLNGWWRDMPLRREGDAMLFTGLMYQSVPYIQRMTEQLARYEDTFWARFISLGRYVPSFAASLAFRFMAPAAEKRKFNNIVKDIHRVLVKSNVDFFYRPELDFYCGVLLYDPGDVDGFARHAAFVAKTLKSKGIQKLITVDPHTTYAVKVLYPPIHRGKLRGEHLLRTVEPQGGKWWKTGHTSRPMFLRTVPGAFGCAGKSAEQPGVRVRDGSQFGEIHPLLRGTGRIHFAEADRRGPGKARRGAEEYRCPHSGHVPNLFGQSSAGGCPG
jgi:hypothetical protein